ncbi:hypothetical protein CSA37_05400 [Candidatus Fermentibacteria bacterium]|nr:MAG: hypothetical protein CSA37_05400 [Candidatus Fermentibacteria bacterium]
MILLLALLSVWPADWYGYYASMDWYRLEQTLPELEAAGEHSVRSLTLYLAGLSGAEESARAAVKADSTDFRAWTALALIEMNQNPFSAESLFSKAFAFAETTDPILEEVYAYWLIGQNNPELAVEHAASAVAADSLFAPGWLTLTRALSESGRASEAAEVSLRGTELLPECTELLLEHGEALRLSGDAVNAQRVYRKVIQDAPEMIRAYSGLGLLMEESERYGEALKLYRNLLDIAPDYSWAWGQVGDLLLRMGRESQADSSFRTAVELSPDYTWALFMLGRIRGTRNPESAKEHLLRAIELNPDYLEAWQELVFVYESLDELSSAEAALRRCIELEDSAWLNGELGWVLESMNRFSDAAVCYERGVELDSQYLYGWQRRGDLYLAEGELEHAEQWFSTALERLKEPDPWIMQSLGRLLAGRGKPDSALVLFQGALAVDGTNCTLALDAARSLVELEEYAAALSTLDSCFSLQGCDSLVCMAEKLLILEAMGEDISFKAESLSAVFPDLWINGGWSALESHFTTRAVQMAERVSVSSLTEPWSIISLADLNGELGREDKQLQFYLLADSMPDLTVEAAIRIANFFFQREMYEESIELLSGIQNEQEWSEDLVTALAEAYLFNNDLDTAEELLLEIVERNPYSIYSICYLGLIQENRGNPELAAEKYLEALRLEPGYGYAEDRLRYISGENYDPAWRRDLSRTYEWALWFDLSSTGGNTEEQDIGGGGSIAYNYSERGSSVELETRGRVQIKNDVDQRRTAWASISGEHFLTDNIYAGGSVSWDRQPLTVRPWQVSSYIAAGWKSWPRSWIWIAPEAGAGLVNTKWSVHSSRRDIWTVYGSLNLWARGSVNWLPSLWLSASIYAPPENVYEMVANGVAELEFYLPGPLSLVLGSSLDYTSKPVVDTWKELDSEIYLRLRM